MGLGMTQPTVGSLYSGVGGSDLGFERAGYRVAWQAECDPWRARVLASHWPDVSRYPFVEAVKRDTELVSLLCVSPPASDPIWLDAVWAVVERLRPALLVIETGLRCADALREGFSRLGYHGIGINLACEGSRLERLLIRTARSFAIARDGTRDGLGDLLEETERVETFRLDEPDDGVEPETMTQIMEILAGLPVGWTCVCGQAPGQCSETSARLLALNDTLAPALTQWLGTRLRAWLLQEVAA